MTGQQRWDSLGCTGCEAIATPNIDRLAAEGALFDQCYVNATICTPSRASLLTGKTVPNHGVYRLHDRLTDDQVLFPAHLQQQGYQTALIGKLHVPGRTIEAETRHPNDGFDEYEWCIDPAIHLDSPFNAYVQWLAERDPTFHQRLLEENRQLRHFPAEHHFTRWVAERTIHFLEKQDGAKPFFCQMSLFDPHDPYFDYPQEMA